MPLPDEDSEAAPAAPEPAGAGSDRHLYESERHGFAPSVAGGSAWTPEPEFEDEAPGSLVSRWRLGPGALFWGVALLGLEALLAASSVALRDWLGIAWFLAAALQPEAAAPPALEGVLAGLAAPLALLWRGIPVLAFSGVLVMSSIRLLQTDDDGRRRRIGAWAILLQALALALWCIASSVLDVGFTPSLPAEW
jgi:hypothetical protein